MTLKKYIRLSAVLFLPLLFLGYLISFFALQEYQTAMLLCEPGSNCRNVGPLGGELYRSVRQEHKTWFQVDFTPWRAGSTPSIYALATSQAIGGAQILRARPFAGFGPDAASSMSSLEGRSSTVQLGIENEQRSIVDGDGVLLYCSELSFKSQPHLYEANCYGDGWGGPVSFSANSPILDALQTSIKAEEKRIKADYLLAQLIMYPILIYAFLLMSLLYWGIKKAIKFVRAG